VSPIGATPSRAPAPRPLRLIHSERQWARPQMNSRFDLRRATRRGFRTWSSFPRTGCDRRRSDPIHRSDFRRVGCQASRRQDKASSLGTQWRFGIHRSRCAGRIGDQRDFDFGADWFTGGEGLPSPGVRDGGAVGVCRRNRPQSHALRTSRAGSRFSPSPNTLIRHRVKCGFKVSPMRRASWRASLPSVAP